MLSNDSIQGLIESLISGVEGFGVLGFQRLGFLGCSQGSFAGFFK